MNTGVAPDVHRHAETPTAVITEKDLCTGALLRRELIRSHQLHGGARKHLLAAVSALVQHHAAEGQVIVDRRDEPVSGGTWNAVSFMPSGSKRRSRRNVLKGFPDTREIKTPSTSPLT